jgi:hypothetical protein
MILINCTCVKSVSLTVTSAQISAKESTAEEGVCVLLQTRRLESIEKKERKTAATCTNEENVRTNGTLPGSIYWRIRAAEFS